MENNEGYVIYIRSLEKFIRFHQYMFNNRIESRMILSESTSLIYKVEDVKLLIREMHYGHEEGTESQLVNQTLAFFAANDIKIDDIKFLKAKINKENNGIEFL